MICKNCGTENSAESIFCSNCGQRLDTIVTETPAESVQPVVPEVPVQPVPAVPVEPAPIQEVVNPVPSTNNGVANEKPKSGKIGLIIGLVSLLLVIAVLVILFVTGVISFGKNSGGTETPTKKEEKKENKVTYEKTQAVTTVDGSKWHVIDIKGDTVTLLLDELVVEETGFGKSVAPEDQIYENSNVKEYIDGTYMPELSAKIDAAGGDSSKIKGRVITAKEYLDSTGTKFDSDFVTTSRTVESYDRKEEVCKFLDIMSLTKSFWTSTNVQELDTTSHFYGVVYVYRENSKYDYFCDKDMTSNFAVVDLATNSNYQLNATLVGIRPVIETPTSNIK